MIEEKLESKTINSWLMNCPACSAVNSNLAEFCQQCNYKFEANLDPLGVIYSEGEMLRKSVTQKPRLIVLLGAWIFFFPVFITTIALVINLALNESGTMAFVMFWVGIIICFGCVKMLYTITKNYLTMKDKVFERDGEMLHQEK